MLVLIAGWNELLIAAFSHRSLNVENGLVLANNYTVYRHTATQTGIESIFDRVLTELVAKMKEMKMDKTEIGCLRTIILFNPSKSPFFGFNLKVKIIRSDIKVLLRKDSICRSY